MKFRHAHRIAGAAAIAAIALVGPARAEEFINILTGGTSGVYYPLGVALSKVYGEKIKDARVQVQATKASVENLNLLQQGRGELAFTLGDSLKDAWAGNEEAGFKAKLGKLRGVAAIYPNYIQIVATKDSGIKTLADLKGKSLSVGAAKSGTELNARAILGAAGITYKDLKKVEYLDFGQSVDLMKNGQIDASIQSAGLGVASIRDLASGNPITIVSVPAEIATKLGPPFIATPIPAKTYDGQDAAVPTVAVQNYLVTREGVPAETVYQMVKDMYENMPTLIAAHGAAKQIKVENALSGMPIPLHPGAEKYFKEKGIAK
jgi:TRAP transporter TAXI family solute receptor